MPDDGLTPEDELRDAEAKIRKRQVRIRKHRKPKPPVDIGVGDRADFASGGENPGDG